MHLEFRNVLPWLPLLVTPILLVGFGTDKVAVAPIWQVGVAVTAVFFLVTLTKDARHGRLDYVVAALLGIAAAHRLFLPGFPRGHDIVTHLWGTYGFYRSFLDGNFFPRWIHHIGIGMPFLLFYPPLSFYLLLPFLLAGATVFDAFKGGLILFNALSGISMLFVMRQWLSDRRAALFAAGIYCFAPYHLLQSQYRVALAEAAAMVILPLFVFYVHSATRVFNQYTVRKAAVVTAALALTHPLSLSMAATTTVISLFARSDFWPDRKFFRGVFQFGLVGLLGALLAGYYTVPVAAESQYVTIGSAIGGGKAGPIYTQHGLGIEQLLERRLWHKWQKSESRGSEEEKNEMPFYFGLTLLALIPLARAPGQSHLIRELRAITLVSLLLCLYPLDKILGPLPFMAMLQFPWRFLTVATVGASLLGGFAMQRLLVSLADRKFVRLAPGLLFALFVADAFPYTGAAMWAKAYQGISKEGAKASQLDPLPLRIDHFSFPPSDPHLDVSLFRRAYPEYFTPAARKNLYRADEKAEVAMLERISVGVSLSKTVPKTVSLKPASYAEFTPGRLLEATTERPAGSSGQVDGGAIAERPAGFSVQGGATPAEAAATAPSSPAIGETSSGVVEATGLEESVQHIALDFERGGEKIRVKLSGEAGTLVIKEMFFPGWSAMLNGHKVPLQPTPDGLMEVRVQAGDRGMLELSFSRTRWDRLMGGLLSLVMGVGLFIPWRKASTKLSV